VAGDWIKIRSDLPDEDEVLGIAHRIGIEPDLVVGKLVRFWAWVDKVSPNGRLRWATLVDIDRRLTCPGFADALKFVGWLEEDTTEGDPVLVVPHYERHMSQSAKRRAVRARQRQEARRECRHSVAKVSPFGGDKVATREEKRREEIKEGDLLRDPLSSGGPDDRRVVPNREERIDWTVQLARWNEIAGKVGLQIAKTINEEKCRRLKAQFRRHGGHAEFWGLVEKACLELGSNALEKRFVTLDFVSYDGRCTKLLDGNYSNYGEASSARASGFNEKAKYGR
jgi:hypothetical protein